MICFPWGHIQSALLENKVKIGSVSVNVNGVGIVRNGEIVNSMMKLCDEALQKREIKSE